MPDINSAFINRFEGDIFINVSAWGTAEIDQIPYAEFYIKVSKKQAKDLIKLVKQPDEYNTVWGFYKNIEDNKQIFLIAYTSRDMMDLELIDEEIERNYTIEEIERKHTR